MAFNSLKEIVLNSEKAYVPRSNRGPVTVAVKRDPRKGGRTVPFVEITISRELMEECGMKFNDSVNILYDDVINVMRISKSSDTAWHLKRARPGRDELFSIRFTPREEMKLEIKGCTERQAPKIKHTEVKNLKKNPEKQFFQFDFPHAA